MATTGNGLRIDGTILGQSTISMVDGPAGRLIFRGYELHDLVSYASWEEVLYLLWYGALPTQAQLDELQQHLARERALTADEVALLRSLPATNHGMAGLQAIVSAMAYRYGSEMMHADTIRESGLRLTARLPTLLTTWIRLRQGLEPVEPDPALGTAANMLLTLLGERADATAAHVLDSYMVVTAENGLNISTFVARVITSTRNTLATAISAAIGTLGGVVHGGANEQSMRTFLAIGTPEQASAYIEALQTRKERLMGVGHRVFEVEDPRLRHMRRLSQELADRPVGDPTSHQIAAAVEAIVQEHPFFQQRRLYPNVEFYSAPLLYQLGFPVDCFTAVFACARMPGWIAHIMEQLADNQLVRPEMEYIGPLNRPFQAIAER
ncbi:MAG: tungsten formylmethanofuran dehydrogenase [Chloroflexaceae bacterium]|nr:tungsten formylmethanofuran dehydrogenase [Chloroflexaceae bacterium]